MRDITPSQSSSEERSWPQVCFIHVSGTGDSNSDIGLQSPVAVFEISPRDCRVKLGVKNGKYAQLLPVPLQALDGMFGMRVGREDVECFVIPLGRDEVIFRLVEVTTFTNPYYRNLTVY